MRPREPLGTTSFGIMLLGALGAGIGGLTTFVLISFRPEAEPVLRIILPMLAALLGGHLRYTSDYYWPSTALVGVSSVFWLALMTRARLRLPGQNRMIDAGLRAQLSETARGAPLDPRQ